MARVGVLAVALPIGRDVACVADGKAVDVRGVAEQVDNLEARGLLALDAIRVHAIDQRHGVVIRETTGEGEAVVEVALDLQQGRAMDDRLRELAHCDLALRHEHGAHHSCLDRVGRGTGGGVARRCADDRARTLLSGLADGHRHAPVLEGTRGIGAVVLQPDLAPRHLAQRAGIDERGASLAQRDDGSVGIDRQPRAVLLDEATPLGSARLHDPASPSTRMTPTTCFTTSSPRRASMVRLRSPSCARCVRTISPASSPWPS